MWEEEYQTNPIFYLRPLLSAKSSESADQGGLAQGKFHQQSPIHISILVPLKNHLEKFEFRTCWKTITYLHWLIYAFKLQTLTSLSWNLFMVEVCELSALVNVNTVTFKLLLNRFFDGSLGSAHQPTSTTFCLNDNIHWCASSNEPT